MKIHFKKRAVDTFKQRCQPTWTTVYLLLEPNNLKINTHWEYFFFLNHVGHIGRKTNFQRTCSSIRSPWFGPWCRRRREPWWLQVRLHLYMTSRKFELFSESTYPLSHLLEWFKFVIYVTPLPFSPVQFQYNGYFNGRN